MYEMLGRIFHHSLQFSMVEKYRTTVCAIHKFALSTVIYSLCLFSQKSLTYHVYNYKIISSFHHILFVAFEQFILFFPFFFCFLTVCWTWDFSVSRFQQSDKSKWVRKRNTLYPVRLCHRASLSFKVHLSMFNYHLHNCIIIIIISFLLCSSNFYL